MEPGGTFLGVDGTLLGGSGGRGRGGGKGVRGGVGGEGVWWGGRREQMGECLTEAFGWRRRRKWGEEHFEKKQTALSWIPLLVLDGVINIVLGLGPSEFHFFRRQDERSRVCTLANIVQLDPGVFERVLRLFPPPPSGAPGPGCFDPRGPTWGGWKLSGRGGGWTVLSPPPRFPDSSRYQMHFCPSAGQVILAFTRVGDGKQMCDNLTSPPNCDAFARAAVVVLSVEKIRERVPAQPRTRLTIGKELSVKNPLSVYYFILYSTASLCFHISSLNAPSPNLCPPSLASRFLAVASSSFFEYFWR